MEVNGIDQLSGYWHSSKYLLLCSANSRRKKFIQVWNLRASKGWGELFI